MSTAMSQYQNRAANFKVLRLNVFYTIPIGGSRGSGIPSILRMIKVLTLWFHYVFSDVWRAVVDSAKSIVPFIVAIRNIFYTLPY